MIRISMMRPNQKASINSLVERSPEGTVYHLTEWGDILTSVYGVESCYLVANQDGNLIGVFPLIYVRSLLFGTRLISLPLCEYGGPLLETSLGITERLRTIELLLEAARKLARLLAAEYVEIRNPPATVPYESLLSHNLKRFQRYVTFQIDLTKTKEKLWSELKRDKKRGVKKAIKRGVEITEVHGVERLRDYYRLYLYTEKRHGSPPHSYRFFQELYRAFRSNGKIEVMFASYKGKAIAGIINLYCGTKIFWRSNVIDDKYRNLAPTNLLLWTTIEKGSSDGYRVFDLGRTRKGTTIYDFKSGWAGQQTTLEDYALFLNSRRREFHDPSHRRYEFMSRLWSLLPSSSSRRIGPKIRSRIAL